jgi:hypothetical protein
MKRKTTTLVVAPRRELAVLNGGSNRGARENLAAFEIFNRRSQEYALVVTFVDTMPGRAPVIVSEAGQRNIRAVPIEGRFEEVLPTFTESRAPAILNLDRPASIATALKAGRGGNRPFLVYLLLRFPPPLGVLWGLRLVLTPAEPAAWEDAIRFFEVLAEITARRGAAGVIETGADGSARERLFRAWFVEHTVANLSHVISGTEPDHPPFEAFNGERTMPVIVRESTTWADPVVLAQELAARPPLPLMRGDAVIIAEVRRGDGIRFHLLNYRRSDGQFVLRGGIAVDAARFEQLEIAERQRRIEAALREAQRMELSRRAAAMTTD